ncbi:Uncharacterized protein APZ42_018455 [Daphnia magna]|uniref:Uncharacterized protein n=1 Tax=Daphnia magna TaxID=35525 RepID=A0A164Z3E6_9CRUS|nr:Uncharacterized protein APZ42_018455 [Daphnia magna]
MCHWRYIRDRMTNGRTESIIKNFSVRTARTRLMSQFLSHIKISGIINRHARHSISKIQYVYTNDDTWLFLLFLLN